MKHDIPAERFDTVVVGGGQAGLVMGYYLKEQGRDFVILDAEERVGDAWRKRWDSLRLFSPAAYNTLPGFPFPAPGGYFPTKDDVADYLEEYASKLDLPVRLGRRVESLKREGDGNHYLVSAGQERYMAPNVVVATGAFHTPGLPTFAKNLDPSTTQLHSSEYKNPGQLPNGDVLVVGVGNSGAEIAVDIASSRKTYLSGKESGNAPLSFSRDTLSRPQLWLLGIVWWLIDHVFTMNTRPGRKLREVDRRRASPLIRQSPEKIINAGVERVPRVEGVVDGKPLLADRRVLEVASVVWATGYKPDFGWIELPVFAEDGLPIHYRGVVNDAPGLYFLGLPFQYTITSAFLGGVVKDGRYIAYHIARSRSGKRPASHSARLGR